MWAQHALEAAAFYGADLRPALPAIFRKLGETVNHYAADAIRTWASRSTEAAAEARAGMTKALRRSSRGTELAEELAFLSKRQVPDAEARWTTDRERGVRVRAGRLYWLTSHGWDEEQSIPEFVRDGVPRDMLRTWTGSWLVPPEVQAQVRGWLGLPPEVETAQARALKSLQARLAEISAATWPVRLKDCALCRALGQSVSGSPLKGFALPPESAKLSPLSGFEGAGDFSQCPHCGTLYRHEYTRECEVFEEETDWECLSRVTHEELRALAMEAEFGTAKERGSSP